MNWLKLYKNSQIWKIPRNQTFLEKIETFYKLEVQMNLLKNMSAISKRKDNIIRNIQNSLNIIIEDLRPVFLETISQWLRLHSFDSHTFGEERVEDIVKSFDSDVDPIYDFINYYNSFNAKKINNIYTLVPSILRNINNFPRIKNVLQEHLDERKQEIENDYENHGLEYIKHNYNQFEKVNNENDFYKKLNTIGFEIVGYVFDDIENLFQGHKIEIAKDLYSNFIFPAWLKRWESSGLIEVKKNIEYIYQLLLKASDLNQKIIAINMAINAAHSNGMMLDYVEDKVDMHHEEFNSPNELLHSLSNGHFDKEWSDEVKKLNI